MDLLNNDEGNSEADTQAVGRVASRADIVDRGILVGSKANAPAADRGEGTLVATTVATAPDSKVGIRVTDRVDNKAGDRAGDRAADMVATDPEGDQTSIPIGQEIPATLEIRTIS
ncbi:MAG: hypothetical protein ACWA5W_02290, partial [Phycisphaerales bacterium]